MNKVSWVFALGLVACGGLSEDDFAEQLGDLVCDKTFECAGETTLGFLPWASAEECKNAEATGTTPPTGTTGTGTDCEFDSDKGQACLDDLEAATCDGGFTLPASCADVCA